MSKKYFKVVAETGSCSHDYRQWEEKADCGHKHRTIEAAEECLRKLTAEDKNGNCSRLWYHAVIHNQNQERVQF